MITFKKTFDFYATDEQLDAFVSSILDRPEFDDEDKEDDKPKEWTGAFWARWLNYEKFSGNEDRKLPQIAKEAEELSGKVGIRKDFLSEETKQLINSIEVYVKALQKRGI